jgi:hypothetical protein
VTAILPGVITPVPFANTAVRLLDAPAVIVAGEAENELIAGGTGETEETLELSLRATVPTSAYPIAPLVMEGL